jgi:hypothetical protein
MPATYAIYSLCFAQRDRYMLFQLLLSHYLRTSQNRFIIDLPILFDVDDVCPLSAGDP